MPPPSDPRPDPQRLLDLANAYFDSCVLFAACEAGVFAHLAERGPATAADLARALGLDPRGLELLLDGATALGLLLKEGAAYRNSPETSLFLVPGSPGDLSRALRYNRDVYPAWGRLTDLVRTGRPVESPELHLGDDPERTRTFVLAMHHRALAIGRGVIPHLALAGVRRLLDVGGGPGTFAGLCARAEPGLTATVLDLPAVAAIAADLIARDGLSDRLQVLPGSYREIDLPRGYDRVHFFGMMHQESPASIRRLLAQARESLVPGGQVAVLDMMTDETHTRPKFSALFAINMALTTESGWVFSAEQLREWMTEAGFVQFRCQPLPPPLPHWLALAERPS